MASGGGQGKLIGVCLVILLTINEARCQPAAANRRPVANEAVFDVTKYNAKGDGKTDNAMVRYLAPLHAVGG